MFSIVIRRVKSNKLMHNNLKIKSTVCIYTHIYILYTYMHIYIYYMYI